MQPPSAPTRAAAAPRVLLDTNVWSRVAEAGAGLTLRLAARKAGARIVAAPSVLYELARIPVAQSRARALRLITEPTWERLMPEAYLEAQEIIAAISRHRPRWLIQDPDLRDHKRLAYDWARRNKPAEKRLRSPNKAGVWERFRTAPDKAARDLGRIEGPDLSIAREAAFEARREALEQQVHTAGPLRSVRARYADPRAGWRGDEFEPWRHEAAESLALYLLRRDDAAYRDWIEPFIDLRHLQREPDSWLAMWLYEIEPKETPRQWARWAIRNLQRFRKVSAGAPCDVQLAAYLTDADVIISADGPFVEIVAESALYAPVPLARAIAMPPGAATVDALVKWLEAGVEAPA